MKMDAMEYDVLSKRNNARDLFTGNSLKNQKNRTLLYGYTCDRETWHVYLKDGGIFTVKYQSDKLPSLIDVRINEDYVPDKRLYPERCDFEFCELFKNKGISLPFTKWQGQLEIEDYYGKIL
jgi:hypothetical protein